MSLFVMTEQFCTLTAVIVIQVYTWSFKPIHAREFQRLCTHAHACAHAYTRTFTQGLVKTDDTPASISWFSQCAMIMRDITIMESWVRVHKSSLYYFYNFL